jgi:hypothetical protein
MVDDLSTGAQAVPKSDGPAAIVGQFWPMMERCELAGADALQTDLIGTPPTPCTKPDTLALGLAAAPYVGTETQQKE